MDTKEKMLERYGQLYNMMATSKDPEKMKVFGSGERYVFNKLVVKDPALSAEWLDILEGICWNNYLSEAQAKMITAMIVNQDGSKGPKWSYETFFNVIAQLGLEPEKDYYFNRYALWTVANAHYSDYANSTAEDMGYASPMEVPAEKMAKSMYNKAVESLTDIDRKHYVERYYYRELIG